MSDSLTLFATCPSAVEPLLARELEALGASAVDPKRSGVAFQGSLEVAYRACLWSRVASRVLLHLAAFPAPDPDRLYDGVKQVPWEDHLSPEDTLAVEFISSGSAITHTHFGALKVKDAVVDRLRERFGSRPNVDLRDPDIRINVYVFQDEARLSLDLSGESLHRRGYRQSEQAAPMKENLAAALLIRAGWQQVAAEGGPLLDPMCGSGTLPIEAAMIAGDIAPGLQRTRDGFASWRQHDAALWETLLAEARRRRDDGLKAIPTVIGYDNDRKAVAEALDNVRRAGLHGKVHVERRELSDVSPGAAGGLAPGLFICNPPYGHRMGEAAALEALYRSLGDVLRSRFPAWRAAVFTGNPALVPQLRLRPRRTYDIANGALPCKLVTFRLGKDQPAGPKEGPPRAKPESPRKTAPKAPTGPGAEMLANRIRKDLRHYGRWARRNGITCYRLYDADLPEYALAADVYHGEDTWVHAQGYEPPARVDPGLFERRQQEVLRALSEILDVPSANVFYKLRRRQKGTAQYEKQGSTGRFHEVAEANCRYWVNFTDYLDTGIYLDHRPVRDRIRELANGTRFLNLFGYTGTATVAAAVGAARTTLTVDLSRTYLDWAQRNLDLNGISPDRNKLEQMDCLEWLQRERARGRTGAKFGLILLDPPTFSNSKRMRRSFDVQRDHPELLTITLERLAPGGTLLFSTNRRNFRMAWEPPAGVTARDITRSTIPKDFDRNPKVHTCWEVVRSSGSE